MSEPIRCEHAERVRDFYRNQGAVKERERIINIIREEYNTTPVGWISIDWLIALIKGETND